MAGAFLLAASVTVAGEPQIGAVAAGERASRALAMERSFASPYRIPSEALAGRIRYRFALPSESVVAMPTTGEQRVVVEEGVATLEICGDCGDESAPTADDMRVALAFNEWIDGSPLIRRLSRTGGRSVDAQMQRLVAAVRNRMNGPVELAGYARASDAAITRSGDCTEYALVLAALAKSRGIPARVAYGWAYSSRFSGLKHHFSPHMWVQVWNGERWRSYDAGMGPFGAGHITLGVGQGNPAEYAMAVQSQTAMRLIDLVGVRSEEAAASD